MLVLPRTLLRVALVPVLAPSYPSPLKSRNHPHQNPTSAQATHPLDCPACRISSTLSSGVEPAPLPVRPWREVKSRRGAPKRIDTQGFACPNHRCPYFGITDADIHALVGDGIHGRVEQIQTFRCQACHMTFSARRHIPLYRLKTPLPANRNGADGARRRAGSFRRRTCLRLPTSHDHYLADSRWRVALLPQPLAPTSAIGRTANQVALLHTGDLALVGHRSLHEDYTSTPSRPPNAKLGA